MQRVFGVPGDLKLENIATSAQGIMRRGKKPEQKEVDVLLAVDMMTHGFNRSMTRAILITGDLGFRPVVESLVRGGIFVEVWYEQSSAVQDLPLAADYGWALTKRSFYSWNSDSFKERFQPPRQASVFAESDASDVRIRRPSAREVVKLVGDGKWAARPVIQPIQSDFDSLPTTAFDLLGGVHGGLLPCDPPPSCTRDWTLRRVPVPVKP